MFFVSWISWISGFIHRIKKSHPEVFYREADLKNHPWQSPLFLKNFQVIGRKFTTVLHHYCGSLAQDHYKPLFIDKSCCEVFKKEIRKTLIVNCNVSKAISFIPKDYYHAIKQILAILVLSFLTDNVIYF